MNKALFNKVLPHLIAVVIFLVVASIYCRPALEGMTLNQHDVIMWEGGNKQSLDFKEKYGRYPLWTNSMFSGMPTFQIAYTSNNVVPWIAHGIFSLGLPEPIQFFFLACIFFYFLCMVLRARPVIGILGALAFAYATYNPVIISAGHNTKMWCIAYMPAVLGSVLLIYDRKYWLGAGLTALFTSILIALNHLQIAYYLFLVLGIMTVFFVVRWIREKELKHMGMALAFTLVAGFTGVLVNAVNLMSTYEYQKKTIRGGGSVLSMGEKGGGTQTGLDKDYAFDYSFYPTEAFMLMLPRIYGGSSSKNEAGENSHVQEALQNMAPERQYQLPVSFYWGGTKGSAGIAGPPYSGVIICFLAILGMFVLDNKHKWWIFTASIKAIMMTWGDYFEAFNGFLFEHLPFYNKFRAPSMTMVIPQLLLPMLAVLTLEKITTATDKQALFKDLKKGLITTGALFVCFLVMYVSFDYTSRVDKQILSQVAGMNQPQLTSDVQAFISAMRQDRKDMFMGDMGKALVYIALSCLLLYMIIKNRVKPAYALAGMALLVFIDLITVDSKYLNKDLYVEPEEKQEFVMTEADRQIKQDTGYYRVFNASGDAFLEAITSYFHNSIGGYHAAKLRIYQDLAEHQFGKPELNMGVLNMLNAKYITYTDRRSSQKVAQQNPGALGPAWLVKAIRYVPGPKEEMSALDNFSPADTAIVQQRFKSQIPFEPQWDSAATISLVSNKNDIINYRFNARSNQFAVFSEIFYDAGWKAFIDGKETPIVKVNYVLRGLAVPAGTHDIEFRFEPQGYYTGQKITLVATLLMLLVLIAGIFMEWKINRRHPGTAKA
jgi:Predicted membrane protein